MSDRSRELSLLARYCVSQSPGFAGIALWVPYVATDAPDFVAYTDGLRVVAGAQFWDYAPLERAFVLCHEILHVALRHVTRGAFAYRQSGAHGEAWNIACDAVINHALGQMSWLQMPSNGVRIEDVLGRELLRERPAATWSAEAIYAHLLQQARQQERPLDEWLRQNQWRDFDLKPGKAAPGSEELASRVWASRLARAQAGDRPGGLLRSLSGDFPAPVTPWPRVLRAWMQDAVLPQSRENWNRPSRRVLAGVSPVWEPATQSEGGIRRAGIVIDTSGSIDPALLTRFCAEASAVQARTGCEIVLLSADAQVQSEQIVRPGGTLLNELRAGQIEFKGGGGTDFRPALARLEQLRVNVALYFTDLAGVFGERAPSMPLLWCCPQRGASAPFGRVLHLDAAAR